MLVRAIGIKGMDCYQSWGDVERIVLDSECQTIEIIGPPACGKSELASRLAMHAEIFKPTERGRLRAIKAIGFWLLNFLVNRKNHYVQRATLKSLLLYCFLILSSGAKASMKLSRLKMGLNSFAKSYHYAPGQKLLVDESMLYRVYSIHQSGLSILECAQYLRTVSYPQLVILIKVPEEILKVRLNIRREAGLFVPESHFSTEIEYKELHELIMKHAPSRTQVIVYENA